MYKEKLIAILEGLECNNIEELIERNSDVLNSVGKEIALNVKTNNYKGLIQVYRQYHALLDEVQTKVPDQSKFETALQIIKNHESNTDNLGSQEVIS